MKSNHQSQKFIKDNSKGKYLKVSKYHHYLKQCDVTKIFFKSLVFLYFLLFSLLVKDFISQFCSSINIFLKYIILFYLLFSKKNYMNGNTKYFKICQETPFPNMEIYDIARHKAHKKAQQMCSWSWYWQQEQSWHGKTKYDKLVHVTNVQECEVSNSSLQTVKVTAPGGP